MKINFEPTEEQAELIDDLFSSFRETMRYMDIAFTDDDLYAVQQDNNIFVFANPVLYTFVDEETGDEHKSYNVFIEVIQTRPRTTMVTDDGRLLGESLPSYLSYTSPRVVVRVPDLVALIDGNNEVRRNEAFVDIHNRNLAFEQEKAIRKTFEGMGGRYE